MFAPVRWHVVQTATPTPGPGPEQLVGVWPFLIRAGWFLAGFLIIILFGWYVVSPALVRAIRRRNRNNPTLEQAIARYFRLFVLVLALVLGTWLTGYGEFLSNSAIVVAAATLALGVGGQEVIGSLISGMVLVGDPEFNVGNYIEWEDGHGTVEAITLRVTRVRTPSGALVTIPNTVLTEGPITRPYQNRHRLVAQIGVDYDADLGEVVRLCEETALELDGVLADPPPEAFVSEFGDDAVVVRVHYWFADSRPAAVPKLRSAYARRIKATLEDAGVTISPPSQHDLGGRLEIDDSVQ
jgi:small-conductance mechanosensitive channel